MGQWQEQLGKAIWINGKSSLVEAYGQWQEQLGKAIWVNGKSSLVRLYGSMARAAW